MQAIVLETSGLRYCSDYPAPELKPGETLIRVVLAGICETDLQLAQGYMGFSGVPGHEFVGVADNGIHAGRRVVSEINCNCQTCDTCRAGRPTHCPSRTVVGIERHDGAFTQWLSVPDHIVHPLPEDLKDDHAVFVEPLAAAFQILEQVSVSKQDRIAVLGDGRLGYLSAMVLKRNSDHVTAYGKHTSKLSRFAKLGCDTERVLSPDVARQGRKSFDVVVDCTGSTSGLPMAIALVRPRGTIVLKTTVAGDHQQSLAPIVIDEINLVGSRCGPFPKAIAALSSGEISVDGLITHRFTLDQFADAFNTAAEPHAFKVVFDIGDAD